MLYEQNCGLKQAQKPFCCDILHTFTNLASLTMAEVGLINLYKLYHKQSQTVNIQDMVISSLLFHYQSIWHYDEQVEQKPK